MISTSIQTLPNLPDAIISLIFEYLPLSNFPNISLSCKTFNKLVHNNYLLWTKYTFSKFLDSSTKDKLETESLIPSYYNPQSRFYEDNNDPKQILNTHFEIKNEWENLLSCFLSVQQKEHLTKEIFEALKNPPPPFPRLKRDTMFFNTNTLFQNFLTEVYFKLNKKCFRRDQKRVLTEELIKNISLSHQGSDGNCENHEERHQDFLPLLCANTLAEVVAYPNNEMKLYKLIDLMIQNHCQKVRSYLSCISEPVVFLEQYLKLWRNFVMITIDLDEIFSSLSNSLNATSKKKSGSSLESDRFAIWRVMINLWTTEIFGHLSTYLAQIINSLLETLLHSKERDDKNEESSKDEEKTEKIKYLIQDVYQAINDLSYDENNIFFWECQPACTESPKGLIDSYILAHITKIYNTNNQITVAYNTDNSFFKHDVKLIKELFGKELAHNFVKLQVSFLQNYLHNVFDSAASKIQETSICSFEKSGNLYRYQRINIQAAIDLLEINQQTVIKIIENKELQRILEEKLMKECALFGSYLSLVNSYKEKLNNQKEKFEEKRTKLLKRGFSLSENKNSNSGNFAKKMKV